MKNNNSNSKKKSSVNNKNKKALKKTIRIIGTIVFSLILVVIITGSILATALTVYVMKFMDPSDSIDLDKAQFNYSTFVYAKDKNQEWQIIGSLANGEKRIWVDIENVPQHVQDVITSYSIHYTKLYDKIFDIINSAKHNIYCFHS